VRTGIVQVARGLAATIRTSAYFAIVYDLPSAQPEARSATIVPSGGKPESRYVSALTNDVLLVAPISDFESALEWLSDGVEAVSVAIDADPTCGGTCTGVRIASWAEFHTVTIGGGADALAIRITLSETNPTE